MGTYKVIRKNWGSFKYAVYGPNNRVITVTSTLWGAKRVIRKHKENPEGLVYEEETIE